MNSDVVEVEVKGTLPTNGGCAVFLGNEEKVFVIYIDQMVGNAIMMFMKDAPLERPQTHDLFGHVLEALGAKVQRVIINDFKDEVYFGIRPEHIYFKKLNEDDLEINLRADLSEYIGHEQIVTFNFSNQEILAKFPSTINVELNKETKLYVDLTQVSLFDSKNEERI